MTSKAPSAAKKPAALPAGYASIHGGIVDLLDTARRTAARSVNALMTASYWEVGRRIVEAEQQGKRRAGYGEQLIVRCRQEPGASGLEPQRRRRNEGPAPLPPSQARTGAPC